MDVRLNIQETSGYHGEVGPDCDWYPHRGTERTKFRRLRYSDIQKRGLLVEYPTETGSVTFSSAVVDGQIMILRYAKETTTGGDAGIIAYHSLLEEFS